MERTVERIRHELKFRIAAVRRNERITPRMARITLTAPEFATFRSDGYDDHVKLFFVPEGETLLPPVRTPQGLDFPNGVRPAGRDYTPRFHDPAREEVVIDFVLHGDGPAASWAARAKPGDTVGVGGPRASFVVKGDFDWHLLVGDETALPAIGRRIEELPENAKVRALIEIEDDSERQAFSRPAEITWVLRSKGEGLFEMVKASPVPPGIGYAFVAGESSTSVAIREHLVGERGVYGEWVKAAGYWRRGEADFYDGHEH